LLNSLSQRHISYGTIRNWAGKGFWAVTDQALFAGTNFMASILLARWLEPDAYGAFSVAYAVFLLIGAVHAGLWTEPMLVFGSGRFRKSFVAYQRILFRSHWRFGALTALVFLLLTLGFWVFGEQEIALSFLGVTFAAPTVFYLWLVRRGAYVLLEPRLAALGGGLYLFLYLGLTIVLLRASMLNATTAFLAMAVAGLLAAEIIRWRIKDDLGRIANKNEVRSLHWNYGRWALLAGLFSWVPGNIYYLILPAFHGLEAAARFKALMNLLMPILHFNGALGQLLVPGMVRSLASGNLRQFVLASLAVLVTFALTYWLLLIALGSKFMVWMYEGKYLEDPVWIIWLGLAPVSAAVVAVMSSQLRAMERPEIVTQIYGILAISAVLAGVPSVWRYGFSGAILTLLLTNTLTALFFIWKTKIPLIHILTKTCLHKNFI
jgi:O-antigen/teichoic acid export membrane protein